MKIINISSIVIEPQMFPQVCVLFPRWGVIGRWWKLRNWGAWLEGLAHCGHGITGYVVILCPCFSVIHFWVAAMGPIVWSTMMHGLTIMFNISSGLE